MDSRSKSGKVSDPHTSIVDRVREPRRTAAPHGVTGPELKRLNNALHFVTLHCQRKRSSIWWVTVAKGTPWPLIAEIWKRVGRLQLRYGLRHYSVLVRETRGGPHAHIAFLGDIGGRVANSLLTSATFGESIEAAPVTDVIGLTRKYLAKERTPQAGYGRTDLGGRIKGSHRLEGGGDRVRLSRDLERDAVEAGYVAPWQHSNSKRSPERKAYRPRQLMRRALHPSGQLPLLALRPVARLREFGGGLIPPSVALEIEFRRRRGGWSQLQLAGLIGRSQGQYANAIRGHDPIAGSTMNRLREILLQGSDV